MFGFGGIGFKTQGFAEMGFGFGAVVLDGEEEAELVLRLGIGGG